MLLFVVASVGVALRVVFGCVCMATLLLVWWLILVVGWVAVVRFGGCGIWYCYV